MLKINEIFYSIQGESSHAGKPCVFVRLTYCNLRCTYCDTEYAFFEGKDLSIEEIIREVEKNNCNLVEITGGEPLSQKESLELMEKLCEKGFEVLLETAGNMPIDAVDKRVKIIMDIKTPSSGMAEKNLYSNLDQLKTGDEVKFVIGDETDYEWMKSIIKNHQLESKAGILCSGVFNKLELKTLAEWILKDNLNVRMQLQMHKYIWEPNLRGV
ncbi:MAG: radical SAM protein [Bacteroidota bacterium]|nr:radical SAM protein [Bacteroidota bacterium]